MGAIALRGGSRRMREISLFVTFLFFFGFFNSPTGRHSGPIFTIYTSNDAFSRKEVPFGGLDDEFSHLPPFFPKI